MGKATELLLPPLGNFSSSAIASRLKFLTEPDRAPPHPAVTTGIVRFPWGGIVKEQARGKLEFCTPLPGSKPH